MLQLLVVFHITLRLPLRSLWWATALVLAPVLLAAVRYEEGTWSQQIGAQLMSLAVAALIGVTVRTRRDYTAALEDRARRLEIERDQQAQLAAAAERARIAREMHDIIGHNLSVITGLADGGRYAAAKSPSGPPRPWTRSATPAGRPWVNSAGSWTSCATTSRTESRRPS